jgi:hypothetical protein
MLHHQTMTNSPGNKGKNGCKCAICGKRLKGYLQWLCKDHRTKEYAAIANAKIAKP